MMDQYFGHKELYEVVLRAKVPMKFGDRYIEAQEPVLYFNNVNMSLLTEQNRPIFARGGWGNMPRVIWEERSEVQFQMIEGVMSSVGMSILLSANVISSKDRDKPLYINMKEEHLDIVGTYTTTIQEEVDGVLVSTEKDFPLIELKYPPVLYPEKKLFIFIYDRDAIQQKIYGKYIKTEPDALGIVHHRLALSLDKNFTQPAQNTMKYTVDYYYKYEDKALIYSVQKERFNGLFPLEAKFYSKDENEGKNYTNVLYMPKVRIVSNINLRLGERADPTVSTFNIIGMPETVEEYKSLIMNITRLDEDIDADI